MGTERFEKKAGSSVLRNLDDPTFFGILGEAEMPAWVRVPADIPGIGGWRVLVVRSDDAPCPRCATEARRGPHAEGGATRIHLEPTPVPGRPGKVLGLFECSAHGFLWLAIEPAGPKIIPSSGSPAS